MYLLEADLCALELNMVEPKKTSYELAMEDGEGGTGFYELFEDFKTIIKRIINKMKQYIDQLKIDLNVLISRKQLNDKLRKLRKQLQAGEAPKTMKFIDVKASIKTYQNGINSMRNQLAKIMRMKCKDMNDIDRLDKKIDSFTANLETFEEDVMATMAEPRDYPTTDVYKFLEAWANSKIDIFDSYYNMIHDLRTFANQADHLLTDKTLASTNIVHCHKKAESLISKISVKVSKTMRKIVIKTILYFD